MKPSWLVDHLESYVFPLALKASADGMAMHHLSPSWEKGKPIRGLRPARSSAFDFEEEGLIFTFLKSYGFMIQREVRDKGYDDRWYPRKKTIPVDTDWFVEQREKMLGRFKNIGEKHDDQFWPIVKNAWRSVKAAAKGRPVILPGRDVWIWEVLARRENYPTLYSSTISRMVAGDKSFRHHLISLGMDKLPDGCVIFDTGFIGTIPQAIMRALPEKNFRYVMLSRDGGGELQVFRNRKGSRERALIIESLPKYEESARAKIKHGKFYQGPRQRVGAMGVADSAGNCTCSFCRPYNSSNDSWEREIIGAEILQPHSELNEIIKAALLTIRVWHGVWPRFVRNPKVPKIPQYPLSSSGSLEYQKMANYLDSKLLKTKYLGKAGLISILTTKEAPVSYLVTAPNITVKP